MKRSTVLSSVLLVFMLSTGSCINPGNIVPDNATASQPFDYDINFADEIQLSSYGAERKVTFTIEATSNSNTQGEEVEVWLEGVPDKVETSIVPNKVKPTANVTLTFTDNFTKPGYYPVILHTRSTSGIRKDYPFKLKSMEKLCTDKFSGIYKSSTNCIEGSNGTGFLNFTKHQAEKDQLLFWWSDYTRYAKVNCYDRTMTFIEQQIGDSTFSGSATYSEDYNSVTMTYNVKRANGTTYSCTTTYTR